MLVLAVFFAAVLDFTANWLAAHFMLHFGPLAAPAGTFAFALSFTTYDYLRRQGGIRPAVVAMALGFIASLAYALFFGGAIGRIAVAGLVALACSSSADLAVQTATLRWRLWLYVLTSNAVSLAIDTLVFTFIAFASSPFLGNIIAGQYVAKVAMTIVAIPLVYWARARTPGRVVPVGN